MSVDPVIQSPTNSQSINSYSYLMNNPLAGIDPTGYTGCAASRIENACESLGSSFGGYDTNYGAEAQAYGNASLAVANPTTSVGNNISNGLDQSLALASSKLDSMDIGSFKNKTSNEELLSGTALALPLATEAISGEAILSILGRALTMVALSISTSGSTPEAANPLIPAEILTVNETLERVRQGAVNIDTGTARALSGPTSPIQAEILTAMSHNERLMTQTAIVEFVDAVRRNGRPDIITKASAFLSTVSVIPDMPSIRVMNLTPARTIKMPDQRIFGTGDKLGIRSITSDQRFVRAAANQGIVLDTIFIALTRFRKGE